MSIRKMGEKFRTIPLHKDMLVSLWLIGINLILTGIYFLFVYRGLYEKGFIFEILQGLLIGVRLVLFVYITLFLMRFLNRLYAYQRSNHILFYLIVLNILISYFSVRFIFSTENLWNLYPVMILLNVMWGLGIFVLGISFLGIPEPLKIWRNILAINLMLAGVLYASYYLVMFSFIPATIAAIALFRLLWLVRKRVLNSSDRDLSGQALQD